MALRVSRIEYFQVHQRMRPAKRELSTAAAPGGGAASRKVNAINRMETMHRANLA